MKLKSKEVVINDERYEVREMAVGVILPMLPRMQDAETQQEAQLDLLKQCVHFDGNPLGDEIDCIGISTYLALAEAVMEVNGLSTEGKD
jgi:hypothetical protein